MDELDTFAAPLATGLTAITSVVAAANCHGQATLARQSTSATVLQVGQQDCMQ